MPLRRVATHIVVNHLTEIFSRRGFPGVVVTDNGPQFKSKAFEEYCKSSKGIKHVTSAPYSPQSNGVMERLHGTLKPMIVKCVGSRGNWAQVIPMVLYFMRLTPGASGFSPFMLSHGWEPNTPLKLLYKVWVEDEFEDIDLEEWVMRNSERVQQLRDEAVVNYSEVSRKRKEKWDKRAVERLYAIGDKVMYRVPGLDTKLADSWIGPFEVMKVLGPVTYLVDFNGGKVRVVHVRFLKEYLREQSSKSSKSSKKSYDHLVERHRGRQCCRK